MKKERNTRTEDASRAKEQSISTSQPPEDRRKPPLPIMKEDDPDQGEVLPLITIGDYYDLLMEQQEQM